MPVRERILVVENDPALADLIARQTLSAAGYKAEVFPEAASALNRAVQAPPDLIIASLNLPGLSAKDLLVALQSQHIDISVIMLAHKGEEANILQTFRLGAADFLLLPAREAEILTAVERVLKQVRERRERQRLSNDLQKANLELSARLEELTAIYSIGKAVTSITDQSLLFERILQGSARAARAEVVWLLLRDDPKKRFYLVAQQGLPPSMAEQIGQPWDDGVSSLVAVSGETLSIHGDAFKRFKIAALGQAGLIVPVKARKEVFGLLCCVRKQAVPFSEGEQRLMEALGDYASISLMNARLFHTLEERAKAFQAAADAARKEEKDMNALLASLHSKANGPIQTSRRTLDMVEKACGSKASNEIKRLREQLLDLEHILQINGIEG